MSLFSSSKFTFSHYLFSSYRFRLVSISCDSFFSFSIDNHDLTVIEVDATNHQPLTVDEITIYAGQRYSFIVCSAENIPLNFRD